ncbi:MAG TPA: ABC transporter substrate-binding protein [Usitatibacter sp.]|nr:ABC transporter substrate-binding protein [Usitatibacter sp.]
MQPAPEPQPAREAGSLPNRIVCLTEEPTEILYALGEERRIVGISGFTVRPPRARREKPKVSAFTSAKVEAIVALEPDLAIGFSDIQADIAQALVKRGVEVWIANHRSVDGILGYVRRLGALVGASLRAEAYARELETHLERVREAAARLPRRPRVYFEEWDDPMISAIGWVSELVGIAGGGDVFPERAACALGRDRIVADPLEVVRRAPDIVVGSWCGKKFRASQVAARPGWDAVPAVRDGELHEVKSSIILQPGPAALTDGLDALHAIIARWAAKSVAVEGSCERDVESPCNRVCTIDPRTGYCIGCLRTLDEISRWHAMTNAERARLVTSLAARRPSETADPQGSG